MKSNDSAEKQQISAAKKCQENARYAWKRTAKEKTCEDQSGIREEMK